MSKEVKLLEILQDKEGNLIYLFSYEQKLLPIKEDDDRVKTYFSAVHHNIIKMSNGFINDN